MQVISKKAHSPIVIAFDRGDVFYAHRAIPTDAERYARLDLIQSGEARLVFRKQCLAVVEDFEFPYARAGVIAFIREDRAVEGICTLQFAAPRRDEELRKALRYLDVPRVHVVTGLANAILYGDEVIIADFRERGSYGWIIKWVDMDSYKEAAVRMGGGKMENLRIWRETHRKASGVENTLIWIEGWGGIPESERANETLCAAAEYVIVFEERSRIVRSITLTNAFVDNVPQEDGPLRSIRVGRPLPNNLARRK